jgi:hypothetical protein
MVTPDGRSAVLSKCSRPTGHVVFPAVRKVLRSLPALAVVIVLAYSIVEDVPHSWRLMRNEHARFAGYTRVQRDQAFGTLLPLPMDIFAWYRLYLHAGDRYYLQTPPGAFGEFIDKPTAVRTVARLYLLPAVQVAKLRDANIVVSFDADPGTLPLRYSDQVRSGQQLIFVSRIDRVG